MQESSLYLVVNRAIGRFPGFLFLPMPLLCILLAAFGTSVGYHAVLRSTDGRSHHARDVPVSHLALRRRHRSQSDLPIHCCRHPTG